MQAEEAGTRQSGLLLGAEGATLGITGNGGKLTMRTAGMPFPLAAAEMLTYPTEEDDRERRIRDRICGRWQRCAGVPLDDENGVDVIDKLVVYLGGDPPIPDPKDPNQ
jgi:hypothetical protein